MLGVGSKAFDTIDHKILLKNIWQYDLDDNSLKWFENYLVNRQQLVKVNKNVYSNLLQVKMGSPRGLL